TASHSPRRRLCWPIPECTTRISVRRQCNRREPEAMQYLLHMLINGIAVGALYGVVAMCFVLVYKTSRAINFAQGGFVLVGGWLCWWLLAACHMPFAPGLLLTLVFMLLFGSLIQITVLRPLLRRPAISVI